jgi:hypothetical protein
MLTPVTSRTLGRALRCVPCQSYTAMPRTSSLPRVSTRHTASLQPVTSPGHNATATARGSALSQPRVPPVPAPPLGLHFAMVCSKTAARKRARGVSRMSQVSTVSQGNGWRSAHSQLTTTAGAQERPAAIASANYGDG